MLPVRTDQVSATQQQPRGMNMADSNSKEVSPKEISLGDGFGEVAVKVNGASIEIHADGSLDTYTDAAVRAHPAANDSARGLDRATRSAGDEEDDWYGRAEEGAGGAGDR